MTNYVVFSGQTSSGITLNFGDSMTVLSGGTAINTFNMGGVLSDFGTTSSTTAVAGGIEQVSSGVANGTLVSAGSTQYVYAGGVASNTLVSGTSGTEIVSSGGITRFTELNDSGQQ